MPSPKTTKQKTTLEDLVRIAHESGVCVEVSLEPRESFYGQIEEKVRPWVKLLRDAGINTESSCHHEGYIVCQSLDQTVELRRIKEAFSGRLLNYAVLMLYTQDNSHSGQHIEIRSPDFRIQPPDVNKEKSSVKAPPKKRSRKSA